MSRTNVRFLLLGLILGVAVSQAWVFFTDRSPRWAPPDPAPSSAPSAANAPAPGPAISNNIDVQNDAVVELSKILPPDHAKATVDDGVSFRTLSFQAQGSKATARLKVTAYASAAEPNVAVVAVFRTGQSAPVAVVSKPLSGNRRETIVLNAEFPGIGTTPLYLDFRIGPGKPGTIVFNGPEGDPKPIATQIRLTE